MDILEVMKSRHSVRQYTDQKIECEKRNVLNELAKACNYSKIDLWIVKYHFEAVSGHKVN